MPAMHTAIPCTGSTADQAVSTVHVQLGAGEAPKLDLWQLLVCMLTKSLFSSSAVCFLLPALSTSTVLGTLFFFWNIDNFIFSTISLIRINLFLSFDFFHISIFYFGNRKTFDQSPKGSFLTEIVSCPPSILIMSFISSTSFQPLLTSFGGTLLTVRDWALQGSPRAAVGFGPKA